MKILILSFYYPPDLCAGSFRCVALAKAIKARGHDIEVLTTRPNRYATFEQEAPESEQKAGIQIYRIPLPPHQSGMRDQARSFAKFMQHASRHVKNRKYDAIIATSSRLMTAALGAWVANRLKLPLYLDIRDIFADTMGDILPPKIAFFLKPLFSSIERFTVSSARHVNLVSKGFESYFKLRYPKTEFSYFTNGVDADFIRTVEHVVSDGRQTLTALYAGNIGEGQGLDKIIPKLANQLVGQVVFQIIGDGGGRVKLERAIAEMGCTNVQISPPLDRAHLLKAYQEADILFLHLNDYAAFRKVLPSKIFEYAAMGKPIWAGVSGYAAEFIQNEVTNAALFDPGDVTSAVAAFKMLDYVTEARSSFVEKFARDNIMQKMACDVSRVLTS